MQKETGMISVDEIRKRAADLGTQGIEHMTQTEMIRAIQHKEGHSACYGTDWCKPEWEETCLWENVCDAEKYFSDVGG